MNVDIIHRHIVLQTSTQHTSTTSSRYRLHTRMLNSRFARSNMFPRTAKNCLESVSAVVASAVPAVSCRIRACVVFGYVLLLGYVAEVWVSLPTNIKFFCFSFEFLPSKLPLPFCAPSPIPLSPLEIPKTDEVRRCASLT